MKDEILEIEKIELLIKTPLIKYLKENKPYFKKIEDDTFEYEFRWGDIAGQAFMKGENYKWAINSLSFNLYDDRESLLTLNDDNSITYTGNDDELLFLGCEREFWCWESGEGLESIKDIAKILKVH